MSPPYTAYVVDDDPSVLKALGRLLDAAGYDACTFSSPREFLVAHDSSCVGCAIIDISMPDLDGLALQEQLVHQDGDRPIIFLTGYGDIPTTVQAMRAGAIDFLTKPIQRDALLASVKLACERDLILRETRMTNLLVKQRMATLTPREREVLSHVVAGRLNKQTARDLGTVEKTIKVHRARMMQKMGVRTVADLVRMIERIGGTNTSSFQPKQGDLRPRANSTGFRTS